MHKAIWKHNIRKYYFGFFFLNLKWKWMGIFYIEVLNAEIVVYKRSFSFVNAITLISYISNIFYYIIYIIYNNS